MSNQADNKAFLYEGFDKSDRRRFTLFSTPKEKNRASGYYGDVGEYVLALPHERWGARLVQYHLSSVTIIKYYLHEWCNRNI